MNLIFFYILFIFSFLFTSEGAVDSGCYDSGLSVDEILRNLTSCGPIGTFNENFEVADLDEDGNLTLEEFWTQCYRRFEELLYCNYDSNRDGSLNVDEFILGDEVRVTSDGVMEYIDLNHDSQISESELTTILDLGSINSTNLNTVTFPLSYPEFAGFVKQIPNETFPCIQNTTCPSPKKSYWTIFDEIDEDKSGSLSFEEFTNSEFSISIKNETFETMDHNGDGLISNDEWSVRLGPEFAKRSFENSTFNVHDVDKDGKWNKTELASYLQEMGLEDRHAWFIMYKNKGSLILTGAFEFSKTLPNPNFRIIVETDEEVVSENYVKGIPHNKRKIS